MDEYTREDGTNVCAHWRSKPEGGSVAVPTGGASGIEVKNIDKILDCGLEKYFGLPAGALLNYRRGIIDYADYPKEIQEKMAFNEILQGVLYEKTAKIKYPISSALLNNAMRNFESAKADKNAEVLHGMNELKPSVRQALKDYGVPENSSGVIYNEESFVSKSFSNSSELKNWINNVEIINKIRNGQLATSDLNFVFGNKNFSDYNNFDRYSSLQNARLVNPRIVDGYLEATIVDYYDFERRLNNFSNIPNNWGHDMQKKGILQNYYLCIKVRAKVNSGGG